MRQFTVKEINRSAQRFSDYANDSIESDMSTFEDRLKYAS